MDPGPYPPFNHGRRPLIEVTDRMIIIKRTPACNAALHFTIRPPPNPPKEPLAGEDQIAREETRLSMLEDLINEYRGILDLLQSNVSYNKAVYFANQTLQSAIADNSINPERYAEIKSTIVDDFGQPIPSRIEGYNVTIADHVRDYDDYLDFGDFLNRSHNCSAESPVPERQPTAPPTTTRGLPPPAMAHRSTPPVARPVAKSYAAATTAQDQPDGRRPVEDNQARSAKRRPKTTSEYVRHQEWAAGVVGNHVAILPDGGVPTSIWRASELTWTRERRPSTNRDRHRMLCILSAFRNK